MTTSADSRFEVHDSAMRAGAGELHNPMSALGTIRQGLLAREVPAEAFANVPASQATGARHQSNITDNATMLATAGDSLRQLSADVAGANQKYRQFDEKKSQELGPQLAQAETGETPTTRGTVDERDQANRTLIERELTADRTNLQNLTGDDRTAAEARIQNYEQLLATDAKILRFDPTGNGRVVAMVGDINARTDSVGVFVPGMGSGLHNFGEYKDIAGSFAIPRAAGDTAMVVWMDGDFPAHLGTAISPEASQEMAPRLRDFVNTDLRTMTGNDIQITVIGHSYGGAVVGLADAAGMQANNVVHVESAGMGYDVTEDALNTANPDVTRYSITSPHDPISSSQGHQYFGYGHGPDPDTFPGNIALHHGRDASGTTYYGVPAHLAGNVLGMHSDSWRDVWAIITGGQVPAAPVRPGR